MPHEYSHKVGATEDEAIEMFFSFYVKDSVSSGELKEFYEEIGWQLRDVKTLLARIKTTPLEVQPEMCRFIGTLKSRADSYEETFWVLSDRKIVALTNGRTSHAMSIFTGDILRDTEVLYCTNDDDPKFLYGSRFSNNYPEGPNETMDIFVLVDIANLENLGTSKYKTHCMEKEYPECLVANLKEYRRFLNELLSTKATLD